MEHNMCRAILFILNSKVGENMTKNRALTNPFIKWSLKIISAVVAFSLLFLLIQSIFIPRFPGDSSTMVKEYSNLEENSVEALFLGSSQMFCTIDSGKLTDEYGISSFNYGASSQTLIMTQYYFDQALKTQSPQLIMIEIGQIFLSKADCTEKDLVWTYTPMPASTDKYRSLKNIFDGDRVKAAQYTFAPLLVYHDKWSSFCSQDIKNYIDDKRDVDLKTYRRGFFKRDHVEEIEEIAYYSDDTAMKDIPRENQEAIFYFAGQCKQRNIRLCFFKSPSSTWTKGESMSVKEFMSQNHLHFIDLNDHLEEIGIDQKTDFYNQSHLNSSGAAKATDYLGGLIQSDALTDLSSPSIG